MRVELTASQAATFFSRAAAQVPAFDPDRGRFWLSATGGHRPVTDVDVEIDGHRVKVFLELADE